MSSTVAPPVDERAEEIVVGELISFPRAVGIVAERGLKPDDFYNPSRRVIYQAALKTMQSGSEANEVTIWSAIEALGHAAPHGLALQRNWIEAKAKGHGILFGVGDIAGRLMDLADRHRKFSAAHKILGAVGLDQPDEYNAAIQVALEELAADHEVEAQPTTPDEIAMFLHDFLESEAPATAWPLPWPRLNRGLPGGLLPGQTSVWMGWTNHGKSAAIDEAVAYWHARGARCGLIGTEMSLLERGARTLQTLTGISSLRFLSKDLTAEEKVTLAKAIQPQNLPFAFHDAQGWSYHRIAQLITLKRYDIAVIDPLNLITGFADQATMTEAARSFQSVARRAGTHLAMVCHLNRKRSPQGGGTILPKPHHYDIRDSGMIANNADVVVGVYRDQDVDGEPLAVGEIYLDKVRVGFRGSQDVTLDPVHLRFKPILAEEREAEKMPGQWAAA